MNKSVASINEINLKFEQVYMYIYQLHMDTVIVLGTVSE
jgi:hypothetical protein